VGAADSGLLCTLVLLWHPPRMLIKPDNPSIHQICLFIPPPLFYLFNTDVNRRFPAYTNSRICSVRNGVFLRIKGETRARCTRYRSSGRQWSFAITEKKGEYHSADKRCGKANK